MNDVFAKHQATYATWKAPNGWDVEWLSWREPGTNIYAIIYLQMGPFLFICGDVGEATFSWSESHDLAWIASCNLDYFLSKCRASESGTRFEIWDEKKAKERLTDRLKSLDEEREGPDGDVEGGPAEQRFDECGGWGALEDRFTWDTWAADNAYDVFGDDWYEGGMGAPGMTTHPRAILIFEGLKLAIAQLKERRAV